MIRPETWDAVCVRALIGISVVTLFLSGLAAYHAGLRHGRAKRG